MVAGLLALIGALVVIAVILIWPSSGLNFRPIRMQTNAHRIPRKVLYLTTRKSQLPTYMQFLREQNASLSRGYETILMDDDDCIRYLAEHYGPRYVRAFS